MSEEISNAIAQEEKGKRPGIGEYCIAALLIIITTVVVVVLYGNNIRTRFEQLSVARNQQNTAR